MSSYPTAIATFRDKENLPGMTYDVNKKTTLYVEDLTSVENEVIATQTKLGTEPQGAYSDVKSRLNAVDSSLAGKQNSLGYTAENTSNKDITAALGSSDTKYPSQKAVKTYVDNAIAAVKSALYPVGSIYTNATTSTNPGTYLGFGTWEAFSQGRVLVGKAATGTFGTGGATGGAEKHTLSIEEMPSHTHNLYFGAGSQYVVRDAYPNGVASGDGYPGYMTPTGGGGAHNNLQPYVVVYMWRRTA